MESGALSRQQSDSIGAGTASISDFLGQAQVDELVSTPVEVIAFSDEEGLRSEPLLGLLPAASHAAVLSYLMSGTAACTIKAWWTATVKAEMHA